MRGCSTLPTNLLHGWPVMGTPNRSTSKRLIPPSRSAGRATIASRDRHSSTLIAHRPNQHHPRISDESIDAHRLMLKFQIFLARFDEPDISATAEGKLQCYGELDNLQLMLDERASHQLVVPTDRQIFRFQTAVDQQASSTIGQRVHHG